MRNVESFLPTANGSEAYVPRNPLSSLCVDEELEMVLSEQRCYSAEWESNRENAGT